MPTINSRPSVRPSDCGKTAPQQVDLRPDLAAFFVNVCRKPEPSRIDSVIGILAEISAQNGYN